ncbi:glycosyltransferase family 4 protein [Aliamphritea ceti]|uniref:glycosyltransferase family 4 protein n=1 Tax=Aliamphritea ceti TaxID=1524258 RepID=UPI0021C49A6D|nr:glycosyltransferase family 4 protein [Aliamphritea ceti]
MQDKKKVIMIGCSPNSPGGISSVIKTYEQNSLFDGSVRYISSYYSSNKLLMIFRFCISFCQFIYNLVVFKPDIVHVHSASRGSFWRKYIFLRVSCFFGIKTIFHLHSGEFINFYTNQSVAVKNRIRVFLENVDLVIALTPYWKEKINYISTEINVKVLFNPVDKQTQSASRINNQLIFLGRLRKEKGIFELLEACKILLQAELQYNLILAGDGDLKIIEDECERLGISQNVSIVGWVEGKEKYKYLLSSDVFVLPSYFEGLPIGILEAMINNVAVVATNVGGIPDIIDDGQDGVLVEPRDVNALVLALKKVLTNDSLKERLRVKASIKANDSFNSKSIISTLKSYYTQLQG